MVSLQPLALRFVKPEWASEVVCPPHDKLSAEGKAAHLKAHPDSFLAVTGEQSFSQRLAALEALIVKGAFGNEFPAGFYIYRLSAADHTQTGIVCGISVEQYSSERVRPHEHIQPDKVNSLVEQLEHVGAQSSPIVLAFKEKPLISQALEKVTKFTDPFIDFVDEYGLGQQLWTIRDGSIVSDIQRSLKADRLYVMDGHHRAAAATQFYTDLRSRSSTDSSHPAATVFGALFSASELRNGSFHRILHNQDLEDIVKVLGDETTFTKTTRIDEVNARSLNQLAFGQLKNSEPEWMIVNIADNLAADNSELSANLDQVRLAHEILGPLGIVEPADSSQLTYLASTDSGGPANTRDDLTHQLNPKNVLCLIRPTPIETVMAMADAGNLMPPKSTYFEPKAQSGMFLRRL